MKKFLIIGCCLFFFFSCSRKTVPAKPNATIENNNNNSYTDTSAYNNGNVFADSATTAPSSALVMVIADGYGRLVTPKENLPQDAVVKYNNLQLSKGFTVQERANLQARYKMVLPRVLYVPQQYTSSSLKGVYYIYRKKFWYWKKQMVYFILIRNIIYKKIQA